VRGDDDIEVGTTPWSLVTRQEGPTAARVARGGIGLLAASGASIVTGMVSLPFLYGHLGEAQYGAWSLLMGVITVLTTALIGLRTTMTRQVARARADEDQQRAARGVLAVGALWGCAVTGFVMTVAVLSWPWLSGALHLAEYTEPAFWAALLLLLAFLVDSVSMPWQCVLEGTQWFTPVSLASGLSAVAGTGLAIVLVHFGAGLVLLGISTLIVSVGRAIVLIALARRRAILLTPRLRSIRRSDVREVTGYGVRVQSVEMAYIANTQTDRFVLGGLFGPAVVAGFEPGVKLMTLLRAPMLVVTVAVFPAVVDFVGRSTPDRLFRVYLLMTRYLAVVAAAAVAALVASADPLVRLALGQSVPLAVAATAMLAVGYGVYAAAGAASMVAMTEGRPVLLARYAGLSTALNLLLLAPLLWIFGPNGVPLATALSVIISTAYLFARFHRDVRQPLAPLLRILWRPVVAAPVAVLLTWLARPYLPDGAGRADAALAVLSRGALAAAVTVVILVVMGSLTQADLARLRAFGGNVLRPRAHVG
jgi:O-antigen/teichoic acid export membrane protein